MYRAERDRVEVWRGTKWEPVIVTVAQLDGLGGDAYYRVEPADVERVKADL